MKTLNECVVEVLRKTKKVGETELQKALTRSHDEGGKLKDTLVRMNLATEKEIMSLVAAEIKKPFINLADWTAKPELRKIIPETLARQHLIVPVKVSGDTLTLAISDPFSMFFYVDDIAVMTKSKVECAVASEYEIKKAIDALYSADKAAAPRPIMKQVGAGKVEVVKSEDDFDASLFGAINTEAPMVKLVNLILQEAIKRRASDIHLEPLENEVRVRYRVDGTLQSAPPVPKKSQNALLSRLKIMSRLDITENRIPQDGRFKIRIADKEVDFRVSVLPVHFGNKVVMRLLDKSSLSLGLDKLGFLPETLTNFKQAVAKPFGMILITGPTGSGKSTTLYSILNQLNTPEKNIITIEDPIEYQVGGITQIQTKSEVGLDFASGLRAILRQSPDVVMVGEIRDSETADIAIKASLTGQLVLSTLHTNDAAGAMTRLVDMGVEPFLIASSVVLVAAQRLCRKVCPDCKQKIDIPKDVFKNMGVVIDKVAPDGKMEFYKGKGCEKCNGTGYYGRMGVLETLLVDDNIKDLVVARASSFQLKDYAIKKGMTTLRDDAIKKMCLGLTTIDEVIRVTSEDE